MKHNNEPRAITELRFKYGELAGQLPRYTSLGMYPLAYIDSEGNVLCADCANENTPEDDWHVDNAFVNWEADADAQLYCDVCGKRIETAYSEEEYEEYAAA